MKISTKIILTVLGAVAFVAFMAWSLGGAINP